MDPKIVDMEIALWRNVGIPKGDVDACWEWRGARSAAGYGNVVVRGKTVTAHRVAWETERGPIPEGMQVCHRCDNPLCVRPDHLFLGTAADNMADRNAKGRQARGEKFKRSSLTEEKVREMRVLAKTGVNMSELARRFGVSLPSASRIVRGLDWRHVTD